MRYWWIRKLLYPAVFIFLLISCEKENPENNRTFLEKLYDLPGVQITEIDPWSTAMFEPGRETNALRIVQPGADHSVRIRDLDEKNLVLETLEEWLDIEIE